MSHLLVTNDFPPKTGGIQSYLWELWRRLPPGEATVLTTPHPGAAEWDEHRDLTIERSRRRVLLPTPGMIREIDRVAERAGADLVMLDPALPLGAVGPHLARPYGVVIHGAEIVVPGRLPGGRQRLGPRAARRRAGGVRRAVPGSRGGTGSWWGATHRRRPARRRRGSVRAPRRRRPIPGPSPVRPHRRSHGGAGPQPIGAPQGLRRAHPGRGRSCRQPTRAGAGHRRGRARPRSAGAPGPPGRRTGAVPGAGGRRRPAAGLRDGRHLRHAVPEPLAGPGAGGLRHRVPGGGGVRGGPGGRRQWRLGGGRGRRGDRLGACATPGRCPRWRRVLAALVDHPDRRTRMGEAARRRAVAEFTYDHLAGRLADALAGV